MTSKAFNNATDANRQQGGRRNLIINGAMQVAQRGTETTGVSSTGYRSVDRFNLALNTLGTYTLSQDSDSPDGFANSFKIDCTTADGSPASSDFFVVQHRMEAQNLQSLQYGTSTAKTLTLSFWVKSNKTGDASIEVLNVDNSNRSVYLSYTINSADTWEYKTLSFSGDTTGGPNNDNGNGLEVAWWLNGGSNFTGGSHTTSFGTFTNANRNASNLGIGGSTNDYWQITGVQLEVGTVATPFEHRSYGEELALCQRYYETAQINFRNFTTASGQYLRPYLQFATTKRASPNVVGTLSVEFNMTYNGTNSQISKEGAALDFRSTGISSEAYAYYKFTFDAEL